MALIPPEGDHWIECEWRLHYPESPCAYSPAYTASYQATLAVNAATTVMLVICVALRIIVMEKRVWKRAGKWIKVDAFEFLFVSVTHFMFGLILLLHFILSFVLMDAVMGP